MGGDVSLPLALVRVGLVLGLLWVVLRLLPRVLGDGTAARRGARARSRRVRTRGRDERVIEVLDRQALTRTASVVVLRIGSTVHAVGVTEQHVDRLVEVPDPRLADQRVTDDAGRTEPQADEAPLVDLSYDDASSPAVQRARELLATAAAPAPTSTSAGIAGDAARLLDALRARTILVKAGRG